MCVWVFFYNSRWDFFKDKLLILKKILYIYSLYILLAKIQKINLTTLMHFWLDKGLVFYDLIWNVSNCILLPIRMHQALLCWFLLKSIFAELFLEQDCYTRHLKRTDLICWMNKQLLVCVSYPPIIGDTTGGSCSHNADQTTLVKARLPATYYSFHTWHFKNNFKKMFGFMRGKEPVKNRQTNQIVEDEKSVELWRVFLIC